MFWTLSLIIIIICPMLFLSISQKFFNPKDFSIYQFAIGLSILVLLGALDGYFGLSDGWFSFFGMILMLLITTIKFRNKTFHFIFSKTYQRLVIYFLGLSIIIYGYKPRMFQFINPDPYGYAAVTGLINRYDGLKNGLSKSIELTGTALTPELNWDQPSNFPKIGSPWYLPDLVDKYGLSNGWIHHNGMSYLYHPFRNIIPEISGFFDLWLIIAILSLIVVALISCEVTVFMFRNLLAESQKITNTNKRLRIVKNFTFSANDNNLSFSGNQITVIELFFIALLLNSPITSMFMLEGFSNQFLSFVFLFSIIPAIFLNQVQITKFIQIIILNLGCAVVYSQHLAYGILILFIYSSLNVAIKLWRNYKKYLLGAFVAIGAITLVSFLLTPASNLLLKYFFNSGVGGANHLGPVSYLQAIGMDPFYKGIYSNPLNLDSTNKFTEHQWSGLLSSPMVFLLRAQGVSFFLNSGTTLILQAILLIILSIYAIFILKSKEIVLVAILNIVLIILTFIYLMIQATDNVLANPGSGFNDYLWMRLLFPIQIFFLIIIGVFIIRFIQLKFSKVKPNFTRLVAIMILIPLILVSITRVSINNRVIQNYGKPSAVSSNCPPKNFFSKKVFLFEGTTPFLGLAICAHPIVMVNDTFPVEQDIASGTTVVSIYYDKNIGVYKSKALGVFTQNSSFTSPCDIQCIKNINGFIEIDNNESILRF